MTAQNEGAPAEAPQGRHRDSASPALSVIRGDSAVGEEPSTALAKYEGTGKYNVLHPIVQVLESGAVSPLLYESVSVVQIRPDAGDTYNDFRYANAERGLHALSGLALAKIAAAAGLKWVPDLCHVEERRRMPNGHLYIRFQAGAAVRQPNGEWYVVTAHKEIDTEDVADQLTDAYERKVKAGRAKYGLTDVPDMVRRDILQVREHLLSMAETKAKNRAIRQLLSLKQVYSNAELAKPFAVPRLIYRPDLTDPRELERVQLEGSRAVAALYGETAKEGPGQPDERVTEPPPENPERAAAATVPQSAPWDTGATEHEAVAAASGKQAPEAPPVPKDDPYLHELFPPEQCGQWGDWRVSQLAMEQPQFVRGLIAAAKAKKTRELLSGWVEVHQPSLGV